MNRRLFWLTCALLSACSPDAPSGEAGASRPPEPSGQDAGAGARDAASPEPSEGARGPRVVFLGTSLTAGLGLAGLEEGYVHRLAEMADSAGIPMEVANAGVSGDTSAGGLRRLDWLLRQPVDVLFVELGANDGLRGQDPAATADNLRAVVERTRARYPGVRVLIAAMEAPPNMGDTYTRSFRDLFSAVARETGATLVPFFLDGVAGVPGLNQDDGIHPTPEGNRRMAANVWPSLEPVLRSWWSEAAARGVTP